MAGMPDVSMLIPLAQKKEMIEILDKEIGCYGKYA